jgi:two-component system response regulator HydG
MRRVLEQIRKVAATDATVLVLGESGTGKELVARAVHDASARREQPFVSVSCAAIPETLLESELFGHEKGAFTGAVKRKLGRFELADGGTLFLDEVGEIPPSVQVKLLRVLQERSFERVGGEETVAVDVRLVSATNRDLSAMVREGRFREDLFYRLDVVSIVLPPLRERPGDVEELARHFLAQLDFEHGTRRRLSPSMLDRWRRAPWPGNVRELRHRVQLCYHLCDGPLLDDAGLDPGPRLTRPADDDSLVTRVAPLAEIERDAIQLALREADGNRDLAARRLGISRSSIYERIRRHGIEI